MLFNNQIRVEGYRTRLSGSNGKLYCTLTAKITDPDYPIKNIKKFLNELGDNYWLNLEEFGYSDLPAGNPIRFDIDFNTYSFSALTKMYLVLKNDTTKFKLPRRVELLNAVIFTLNFRIKHVSRRIRRKVMRALNDPLFCGLGKDMEETKPTVNAWSITV